MAMGRRRARIRQQTLWTSTVSLQVSAGHPFYERLNRLLDEKSFETSSSRRYARGSMPKRWDGREWLRASSPHFSH